MCDRRNHCYTPTPKLPYIDNVAKELSREAIEDPKGNLLKLMNDIYNSTQVKLISTELEKID